MEISIIIIAALFAIWLTPFLVVATSDRTSGSEKLAWLLGMFFISWFAWIFYILLAPLKQREYERV
jgi:hypothetical protein